MPSSLSELQKLGRYKLIRELGRGGMSVVYLANDTELGREVAIKCVDKQGRLSSKLAERLRAEAKLLAQLNNPNIVQLYDVVEQDDILGLVIEFIGGDTLSNRLKQAPTKEIKLKWLAEVAEGLSSAHKKGIAHCDLKADNVLITDENIAKIADFGIAKVRLDDYLEDDGLTRVDSVSGSYFSLSPEQATGQAVDTRTDLFSFAILCFQTLVGHHPFGETSNKVALLQRVISEPLQLSPQATSTLGPRLVDLISNLLSKDPRERIYDAHEATELLRNELLNSSSEADNDYTVAIETQPAPNSFISSEPKKTGWQGLSNKALLIAAGFLVGIALIKLLPETETKEEEISYIALDTIEVTAAEGFSNALLPLIKTTLQQSVENTILSFEQTGLVEAKELNSIEGDYSKKALGAGVKNILVASANCVQRKCDIKLQRRSGDRMAVINQSDFPIASDSLIELSNAISKQLPRLFEQSFLGLNLLPQKEDEESYRKYIEIYTASNSGTSSEPIHFNNIRKLIEKDPNFSPPYRLLYRLATYISQNSGNKHYLTTVLDICKNAPPAVAQNKNTKRLIINTLLDLGKVAEAKKNYSQLKKSTSDEIFLSEIESSIAYAEEDYDKLLELDRQNAVWRPSTRNLYNLATSEFFIGNHKVANQLLQQVLDINPIDPDALDLKATSEMSLGNLSAAKNTYEELINTSQDSGIYSNYGLVLMLLREYDNAIKALHKAVEINPSASLHRLNLGDAYFLSGDRKKAEEIYTAALELLKSPSTAQEYSSLAQIESHLDRHANAVKTLKTANKKFPNIAELDYAASIVNTLAGNYIAAVVDVNDAVERGTAPVWFTFDWFEPLCAYASFKEVVKNTTSYLCKPETLN